MNPTLPILLICLTVLSVFAAAWFQGPRLWAGAQIDLLPALMVYAGLSTGLFMVSVIAVVGGLLTDTLSANPIGVSILPLFVIGAVLHRERDTVLRDYPFAQYVIGLLASAAYPLFVTLSLLGLGERPLLSWGSLWQLTVMAFGGALFAPIVFWLFRRLDRSLSHPRAAQSATLRADREIKRGRL